MTDTRLPERLLTDRRIARLSASEFRSYVFALMWSVGNRTDGRLEPEDLSLIPMFTVGDESVLVRSDLWVALKRGWKIKDFDKDQTSRKQLEASDRARQKDRERKALSRAKKREASGSSEGVHTDVHTDVRPDVHTDNSPDVHTDVLPDVRPDVQVDNIGQDRTVTGQARTVTGQDYKHLTPKRFDHEDEGDGEQYFDADFDEVFGRKGA